MIKSSREFIGSYHGQPVESIRLENTSGGALTVTNYGASILMVAVPDRKGKIENVTLNVPSVEEMIAHRPYYGATIGRVAGRISDGSYIDPKTKEEHQVDKNEQGVNHLHGGWHGFDTKLWDIVEVTAGKESGWVVMEVVSYDGEAGYPGHLTVRVSHSWSEDNTWEIRYQATTSVRTPFNPTNHVYFNLSGEKGSNILDHQLSIQSLYYAPLTEKNTPTGELIQSKGSVFDLTDPRSLSQIVKSDHPQIQLVNGLDHPFYLDHRRGAPDAQIYDPHSGRAVQMRTDAEAVVVYTHNVRFEPFDQYGDVYGAYAGVTLETQQLPDAVHHEGFGDIFLNPDDTYDSVTSYHFIVKD